MGSELGEEQVFWVPRQKGRTGIGSLTWIQIEVIQGLNVVIEKLEITFYCKHKTRKQSQSLWYQECWKECKENRKISPVHGFGAWPGCQLSLPIVCQLHDIGENLIIVKPGFSDSWCHGLNVCVPSPLPPSPRNIHWHLMPMWWYSIRKVGSLGEA